MGTAQYRERWMQLAAGAGTEEDTGRLAGQIARSLLDSCLAGTDYERKLLDLLVDMSARSENPSFGNSAARALFGIVIEGLCDHFSEPRNRTYNRVMAQIISRCRSISSEEKLDRALHGFGLYTEEDLLHRIENIRSEEKELFPREDVGQIIVLSRITIGADVAITSIFLQRIMEFYPEAQIVVLGGYKLGEIFGGHPKVRLQEIDYARKGGVLERLSVWQQVLEIIDRERSGCPQGETIVLDPDSRLTQLGLLPVISPENYFFFDSRSCTNMNDRLSMGELANIWLDRRSGFGEHVYPRIWVPDGYLDVAKALAGRLRKRGARRVVTVNLGVGGNPMKSIGSRFEEKLLISLLEEENTVVFLDKGFGKEESRQAAALKEAARQAGHPVQDTSFGPDCLDPVSRGLIGIQCGLGEIAALIAYSDEFIGYDSACQHFSAALGTPCLTLFTGTGNRRFVRRWSAYGPGIRRLLHIDTESVDPERIVERVTRARRDYPAGSPR